MEGTRVAQATNARRPRCLDLFCGIGGLALGLSRAGVRTIGGVDSWKDARATFEKNLAPLKCLQEDITNLTVGEIEFFFGYSRRDIDIVAGGPPCQGFSTVGKRLSSDPRNALWERYRDLVSEIRPAYVVIENVEGMVVMDRGAVRDSVIEAFGEIGYNMKVRLLRSCDYGVPQLRKRAVFLGWLEGLKEPDFPKPLSAPPVSVADAISDLPALEAGEAICEYLAAPKTAYQIARRKGTETLTHHEAASHPPHLVEILSHIPDGGNRRAIPDDLQPKSGFHNSYARLASDRPAVAVTSNMRKPSSARATHPTQHRGLTVREGLRLQTFDDEFIVSGTRTSQYLQVGNAVPPLLAQAIGKSIVRAFQQNDPSELERRRCAKIKAAILRKSCDLFQD